MMIEKNDANVALRSEQLCCRVTRGTTENFGSLRMQVGGKSKKYSPVYPSPEMTNDFISFILLLHTPSKPHKHPKIGTHSH